MEHKRDSIMTQATAKRVIEELGRTRKGGTFLWHGGEAMLAGRDFFDFVTTLQAELGLENYKNAIQSNGVLITNDWADFFKANQFDVGVSIDGPEAIHNELRIFNNGAGSHKQVMNGVSKLQKAHQPFGVLVVVTRQSRKHGRKILEFMLEHGIKSIDFKPCYGDPKNDVNLLDFARLLIEVFDLWTELDDPTIRIRTLEGFMRNLLGGNAGLCSQNGNCAKVITIDYNGDVFPCDRFIEPEYKFGNINDSDLDVLYNSSEGALKFREHIDENRRKCQDCSYQPVCKSGCTQEQDYWPEEYCTHREMVIDHIKAWLVEKGETPISVS